MAFKKNLFLYYCMNYFPKKQQERRAWKERVWLCSVLSSHHTAEKSKACQGGWLFQTGGNTCLCPDTVVLRVWPPEQQLYHHLRTLEMDTFWPQLRLTKSGNLEVGSNKVCINKPLG